MLARLGTVHEFLDAPAGFYEPDRVAAAALRICARSAKLLLPRQMRN